MDILLRLSPFLPHIIGIILIGTVAIGSYYAVANASSTVPKALWTTNPITISKTGSATDSFKCAPAITGAVVLTVSNPVLLTVTPLTFSSCGPNFNTIHLNAHSATSATVTVTIHRGSQYGSTISPPLTVSIA